MVVVDVKVDNLEFWDLFKVISFYIMLGEVCLYFFFFLVKCICLENIFGNIVECGVVAGGFIVLMVVVIKWYSK